jgi:hypothetical protein
MLERPERFDPELRAFAREAFTGSRTRRKRRKGAA